KYRQCTCLCVRFHGPAHGLTGGVAWLPAIALGGGLGCNMLHFLLKLLSVLLCLLGGRTAMRALRVHADRIDGAVHTDTTGEIEDRLYRILGAKVDDFGALFPSHVKT